MKIHRKKLCSYDLLVDLDELYLNSSLESIHNALQDADDNTYNYIQAMIDQNTILQRQNAALQDQITALEDKITMLDMKINYLLDNFKR